MFKKFLLLLVLGLSCQALLPVKIKTGSNNVNHEFIADSGEFELSATELNQLKSTLIDGIIEDTALGGWPAIQLPVNKQTFALLKNMLGDTPEFNAERAQNILHESTVTEFLPLLYALAFLNTTNEVLLQIVAQHYLAIQKNIGFDDFAQHAQYITLFFQQKGVKQLLTNAVVQLTCFQTLTGHGHWVRSLAFSPDGQTLAAGSFNTIKLWKLANGQWQYTQTLIGHVDWVDSVAFAPDGQTLASGSRDNTIKLWKLVNGQWQCTQTLTEHGNLVNSVAFSPDGQTLASGSGDHTIKLWKLVNGQWQYTQTLTEHGGWVNSVAFSPDGQTLASGSYDNTIKLWKIANDQWQCTQTLTGHGYSVFSAAFSPDGQTLASGSDDRTIKLWKLVNGQWQCTQTLEHTSLVYSSPDGQTLASGSGNAIKLCVIGLDYIQQLVLLWNAHHEHEFRTGISPCLDSIFNSLPEQLQQKIMTTTSV